VKNDEQILNDLAALSLIEYERCRKQDADNLSLPVSALDRIVKELRKQKTTDTVENSIVDDIEAYEYEVDAIELFNEVREVINDYLVLPKHADIILTLWVGFSHAYKAFAHCPRLIITSAEAECGKTMVLDVLETLTQRPVRADNITSAVFFRLVDRYKPTLFIDEYDTFIRQDENLRNVLNSGFKQSGKSWRCVGDNHDLKSFNTHAPLVLGGIGKLHDTVMTRSHIIKMQRALSNEIKKDFDSTCLEREKILCSKLVRWSKDNFDHLKDSKPTMPVDFKNRQRDKWRPLVAVAEIVGGEWPALAFEAVAVNAGPRSLTIKELLLKDIKRLFEKSHTGRLKTKEVLDELHAMDTRSWAEWGRDKKPMTPNALSGMLGAFDIKPKLIRFSEDEVARGYELSSFKEAFRRYLPDTRFQSDTPLQVNAGTACSDIESVTKESHVTSENARKANGSNGCNAVTLQNRLNGLNHIFEQATDGYNISAEELYKLFDEVDLQNVRDGILSLDNLRTVAKDCQLNIQSQYL